MDRNQLFNPNQALHPVSGTADVVPTSQAQPLEQAADPFCAASQASSRSAIRKTNIPSCNLCRRRKIKCDRSNPCAHCVRVGAVCTTSAPSRAPRGRQRGRHKHNSELLDRVAKLENLVKRIEQGSAGSAPVVPAAADGSRTVRNLIPFCK
jgi:hypothetical protein